MTDPTDAQTAPVTPDHTELRRLAEAATPGPWEATGNDSGHSKYLLSVRVITEAHGDFICDMDGLSRYHFKEGPGPDDDGWADAAFIAAARTAVPALLDEVDALAARLSKVEAERDELRAEVDRLLVELQQQRSSLNAALATVTDQRDKALVQLDRVKALAYDSPHKTTDHLGNVTGYLIGDTDLRAALTETEANG